jgi:hypothetical protein
MSILKYVALIAFALSVPVAHAGEPHRITGATPLRLDGVGPIRIGMRLREAERASGMKFTDPRDYKATDDAKACAYVTLRHGPKDLSFMVLNGVIARMDVLTDATNRTMEGVGIGTRERDIRKIYRGAKIQVAPSHYEGEEGGHELTVAQPGRRNLRYFFATDRKKVVGMRIGQKTAVEYVEGCL